MFETARLTDPARSPWGSSSREFCYQPHVYLSSLTCSSPTIYPFSNHQLNSPYPETRHKLCTNIIHPSITPPPNGSPPPHSLLPRRRLLGRHLRHAMPDPPIPALLHLRVRLLRRAVRARCGSRRAALLHLREIRAVPHVVLQERVGTGGPGWEDG